MMRMHSVAALFLLCATRLDLGLAGHPVREDIVEAVNNNPASTWEAAHPRDNKFTVWSEDYIRSLMGLDIEPVTSGLHAKQSAPMATVAALPTEWDSREHFGDCMHPIRNQLHCGSCWAFAAAETLSDSLCVAGAAHVVLSPQDAIECDSQDHGCKGGALTNVWNYLVSTGLVSDACLPYTSFNGTVEACSATCEGDGSGEWHKYKCPKQAFLSEEADIKAGVMQFGSAETGFYVYEDFMNYKSGVYKHDPSTGGNVLGGHAVKIVGWGTYYTQKYWLVANSWGTDWGLDGYFKIDMNDTESGFALGGAFTCGDLTPPAPTPTPVPTCQDILPSSDCLSFKAQCSGPVHMECMETCGCCDFDPPDFCNSPSVDVAPMRPSPMEAALIPAK